MTAKPARAGCALRDQVSGRGGEVAWREVVQMRADAMTWVLRIVAAVFLIGLAGLVGAVASLLRYAQGVPPLPVYLGVVGIAALVLLSGACLALVSIAISARRGVEALRRMAAVEPAPMLQSQPQVFSESRLHDAAPDAPARPLRPSGRRLVAER